MATAGVCQVNLNRSGVESQFRRQVIKALALASNFKRNEQFLALTRPKKRRSTKKILSILVTSYQSVVVEQLSPVKALSQLKIIKL